MSQTELTPPVSYGSSGFISHLIACGLLDVIGAQRLKSSADASEQSLVTIILELGLIEEHKLAEALASFSGLSVNGLREPLDHLVSESELAADFLKRSRILPVLRNETAITFAVTDPFDLTAIQAAGYKLGLKAVAQIATPSEIILRLEELYQASSAHVVSEADNESDPEPSNTDLDRLRDLASEAPTIRLLTTLISKAVNSGASDIHIEPMVDHLRVRFRIDGRLTLAETLDRSQHLSLISRIKVLSRLNIAEQRLPQDGRMRLAIKGREVDFRVATSPTANGEGVVLRILDRKVNALNFQALGFDASAEIAIRDLLSAPNGIVLVTGPTGSGKTTTLYAGLEILNDPAVKIFTVEDPIEYFMKGISQILVKPQIGLDFPDVLRAVLRQDPDIIMVGEIRDSNTATIAVQAALTGHLVLSSLHTNSAAAAITRLRNLGIENYLASATVRGIVAQRLVRRLCPHCRSATTYSNRPTNYTSKGCLQCKGTGYSGRTVIYEVLKVDDDVRNAIEQGAADSELERLSQRKGMQSLYQSGLTKVSAGETTMEELMRVVEGADGA